MGVGMMKALVLSGGQGTRLRPFTYSGAKQLVPLANRPVLFYALDNLVSAGILDVGIVLGDSGDQIRRAVGDGSAFGCHVTYIQQDRPGGLAHAVLTARPFIADSPFVMYLGDNVIQGGIAGYAKVFARSRDAAHLLLHRVPNPQDFGVAELDGGSIVRLEEKPRSPKSDLALVGIYFFRQEIVAAAQAIHPSPRGELEITDAIGRLVADGQSVRAHVLDGWWIDTGKMEDILEANCYVLGELSRRIEGDVDSSSTLEGRIMVERGARVIESSLRGPLIIGEGAIIERSSIGPFSAIGRDCVVRGSELEHTILMERSQILDVPGRIESSLVGRDVIVTRRPGGSRAHKLVLGDHSQVGLP